MDKILALTPKLCAAKTGAEPQTLSNAVTATDQQIDALIYEFYGLQPRSVQRRDEVLLGRMLAYGHQFRDTVLDGMKQVRYYAPHELEDTRSAAESKWHRPASAAFDGRALGARIGSGGSRGIVQASRR